MPVAQAEGCKLSMFSNRAKGRGERKRPRRLLTPCILALAASFGLLPAPLSAAPRDSPPKADREPIGLAGQGTPGPGRQSKTDLARHGILHETQPATLAKERAVTEIASPLQADTNLAVLTKVLQVRDLSPQEAARGYPVRVTGVALKTQGPGSWMMSTVLAGACSLPRCSTKTRPGVTFTCPRAPGWITRLAKPIAAAGSRSRPGRTSHCDARARRDRHSPNRTRAIHP